jgi:membrane protein YqaA with SNARE-associated domain
MTAYLILFGIVLAVNLLPAFGPPTWSIIVLYGINTDLPLPATVGVAALAAASGRFLLAYGFRLLGDRAPEKMRRNLTAARQAFERRKGAGILALGLFALSPVPSAQLFEAAGLARVRLVAFTGAFFAGRLVSYSIYAASARTLRSQTLGGTLTESMTSPLGLAIQVAMIGLLVALTQIDWERLLRQDADVARDGKDLG